MAQATENLEGTWEPLFWVAPDTDMKKVLDQAESIAAAALLAKRTGKKIYWDWFNRIWSYSWKHMVDHEYGAWFRILDSDNNKYDNLKSPAGKTDYHTMGACYEVLNSL